MLAQYLIFAAGFMVFGLSTLGIAISSPAVNPDGSTPKAARMRAGARAIVLAPVWPLAVLWVGWEFVKLSHRAADWLLKTADLPLLRPKVLPPPARGDALEEHERRIDEMIAQLERM